MKCSDYGLPQNRRRLFIIAYKNIEVIVPEGETEETTTQDTLGADKISFEKVFNNSIKLLN